jgi:cytochrome c5
MEPMKVFALAGMLLAASLVAGPASTRSAAPQVRFEPEPGEVIVNRSCLGCHELRRIQTQARDEGEWSALVAQMVENGAEVDDSDREVLVDYLTLHYGPVPDGDGKDILLTNCTVCHDLGRVLAHRGTVQNWQETVITMLNEGAYVTDSEFITLVNYLARNFRPR